MKHNVLIIDCDIATCKEIKYTLSSDTVSAYYALSITEGLKALSKKRYEAVVLDSSFPEADGMEILKFCDKWTICQLWYCQPHQPVHIKRK